MPIRKYNINEKFFDSINTEESAYFLGWIVSDGCVLPPYYVSIDLKKSDQPILHTLSSFICKEKIKITHLKNRDNAKLSFCSKRVVEALLKLGVMPNKSLTCGFPAGIDAMVLRHFIRGYLDGDGTVCKHKNRWYVCFLGTKRFLTTLNKLLERHVGIKRKNLIRVGNIYRLAVTKNSEMSKLLHYLYDDARYFLGRKEALASAFLKEYNNGLHKSIVKSSTHVGVCFDKNRQRWMASGAGKFLGRFDREKDAYARRSLWEQTGN